MLPEQLRDSDPLNGLAQPHVIGEDEDDIGRPFFMPMYRHTGYRATESSHVRDSALCAGCHGPSGNSSNPNFPIIAGQSPIFITYALKAFAADPMAFDLVITDMTMPGIPGDNLARLVKDLRPDIPVILCTGFSSRIDSEDVTKMAIDRLLMKPVGKEEMAKTIRKALDGV